MSLLTFALAALANSPAVGTGRIEVDATKLGARVPKSLYGVFLEEINNAGEGGLYAELIQNRGFEDASTPPGCTVKGNVLAAPQNPSFWEGYSKNFTMEWPYTSPTPAWSLEGDATMQLTKAHPLTSASPNAVEVTAKKAGAKLINAGFWGMGVEKGAKYDLSFFSYPSGFRGNVVAQLIGSNGEVLASKSIALPTTAGWKKIEASLAATKSDAKARFALAFEGTGKATLDFVSLFPSKTFLGRKNGLRPDLAQMIADLKPAFVRWPGGCVVEGLTIETRPRWEETLGPLEGRTPTFIPWGYWVSNGFGYHEWLQFCEDIKAEPLYVFNVGVSCAFRSGTFVPDDELPAMIQNTLEAIEYAIGPVTSKWGALRAKNGHPKPFNMTTIEVGNEQQGPKYGARYAKFAAAIKSKYPKLKIALSSWIAGIDQGAINAAGPHLDILDEHAYKPINWAVQNFDSFASYPRTVPWELYIGEFATNSGVGRGNMLATIGDAAYMMSMEKNADLVKMGSYAPLLENTNRRQWEVNLIHFDSARAYGRASYYACKLFADHKPDVNLATKVDYTPAGTSPIAGPIGLGTYATKAEFKEIKVEQGGQTRDVSNFAQWQPARGQWSVVDGAYRQTGMEHDRWAFFGDGFSDTTLTLKARKLEGDEGFVVSVGNADGRRVQFNVGGWGNRNHGLEAEGVIKQVRGSVEPGRWYDVKVQTQGRRVICSLDGKVIFDETLPRVDRILSIAGKDEKTGDLIVKVVNPGDAPADLTIDLKGATAKGGQVIELASTDPRAENSYREPKKIVPVTSPLTSQGTTLIRRFKPYSVTILRVKTR